MVQLWTRVCVKDCLEKYHFYLLWDPISKGRVFAKVLGGSFGQSIELRRPYVEAKVPIISRTKDDEGKGILPIYVVPPHEKMHNRPADANNGLDKSFLSYSLPPKNMWQVALRIETNEILRGSCEDGHMVSITNLLTSENRFLPVPPLGQAIHRGFSNDHLDWMMWKGWCGLLWCRRNRYQNRRSASSAQSYKTGETQMRTRSGRPPYKNVFLATVWYTFYRGCWPRPLINGGTPKNGQYNNALTSRRRSKSPLGKRPICENPLFFFDEVEPERGIPKSNQRLCPYKLRTFTFGPPITWTFNKQEQFFIFR